MVRDNVTGLVWEVKTDDGGINDKNATYTWANAADVFIAQLNSDQFGGFDDWRMPTREELRSIVNYGTWNRAIDTDFFPNTMSGYYWSYSADAYNPDNAWQVNFLYGNDFPYDKSSAYYVRAVRGGQSGSLDNLVVNGDGTVTDTNTGLMWMQFTADVNDDGITDSDDQMNWKSALAWCENLTLAGYDDWRLPNIKELNSIVDLSVYNRPTIDTDYFPDTMSSDYWSSTTEACFPDYAWLVYFGYGVDYYDYKFSAYYVRAVRGGQ